MDLETGTLTSIVVDNEVLHVNTQSFKPSIKDGLLFSSGIDCDETSHFKIEHTSDV